MWLELAAGTYLVGRYIYHRLTYEEPPKPKPASNLTIPRVDEGSPYPIVYGRCRVRAPILAWISTPDATEVFDGAGYQYSANLFFIIGIPFYPVQATFFNMWVGDVKMVWGTNTFPPATRPAGYAPTGAGGMSPAQPNSDWGNWSIMTSPNDYTLQQGAVGQSIQFYDGSDTQDFIDGSLNANFFISEEMMDDGLGAPGIPSYRGFLSVGLFTTALDTDGSTPGYTPGALKWGIGFHANLSAYSFEIASYPNQIFAWTPGDEANPVEVIRDILTSPIGKLKIPISAIDNASFDAAILKCFNEDMGYSRSFEDQQTAEEMIKEILRQIDGVIYEDPYTGKICIRLIRNDYTISTLPHINKTNCDDVINFAAGGWENIVNKIKIVFTNRVLDYIDGTVTSHNQAVVAAQDGQQREMIIRMPGVCTAALANNILSRELMANSRPIAKCSVIVNRSFYGITPGQAIKLSWPEYGMSEKVFRVGNVTRGSGTDNRIRLDLIEDFYYAWRNAPTEPGWHFPDLDDLHEFEEAP